MSISALILFSGLRKFSPPHKEETTMKKLVTLFMIMALGTITARTALAGDTLADAKKKGVLVVGCKDSLPPFGYIDEKTRQIVGYDIDFVNAIARKMGVKVELK